MRKPLLEKTMLRELLRYDALADAERKAGKGYEDDKIVPVLGFLLMGDNSQTKNEFLDLNDDTKLFNELNNYLRIAKEEGFEIVLQEDFLDGENLESLFVLWNEDGILMSFDTYGGRVNSGCFYYNWRAKSSDARNWFGVFTSGGHFNAEHGVWVGHHDCREALRLRLSDLRENGAFVKPWVERQFLWLMHYVDTEEKGYDYEAIVAKRIAKLPENVRVVIGGK